MKKHTLTILTIVLAAATAFGCASRRKVPNIPAAERFKVGLINAGVYRSLYDKAIMDLSSLAQVELIVDGDLDSLLSKSNKSPTALQNASSFEDVASVQGLDFVLVLLPAPPMYISGAIGLKSINWRRKTLVVTPGLQAPKQPSDWLLGAANGWANFTTDPPGAKISLNDKPIGVTPVLLMVEGEVYRASYAWTPKFTKTVEVNLKDKAWVHVRAPDEYAQKKESTFYARLQAADERHGMKFFVLMYIVVIAASMYLLVSSSPF